MIIDLQLLCTVRETKNKRERCREAKERATQRKIHLPRATDYLCMFKMTIAEVTDREKYVKFPTLSLSNSKSRYLIQSECSNEAKVS